MTDLGDQERNFQAFQEIAAYFVGHRRLGEALLTLSALGPDEFKNAAANPYEFLEGYGIVISRSVGLGFEKTNPTCVTLVFLGYSLRVCAL